MSNCALNTKKFRIVLILVLLLCIGISLISVFLQTNQPITEIVHYVVFQNNGTIRDTGEKMLIKDSDKKPTAAQEDSGLSVRNEITHDESKVNQNVQEDGISAKESGADAAGISSRIVLFHSNQEIIANITQSFVYIPAGEFMMGSPKDEPGHCDNEVQHKVTLTGGFYIQTTEVTQEQWQAVMGNNPSRFKDCGWDCPVESVSWNDIQEFIQHLNQMTGGRYRLPTEAEWEYAARSGTTAPFVFGACLSTDQANYDGNYPLQKCPKGQWRKKTVPVGSFAPNSWGLYDMHGNVWEWCKDWYGEYTPDTVTDPVGTIESAARILRGGSWSSNAQYCRSAFRGRNTPDEQCDHCGFRLAHSSE